MAHHSFDVELLVVSTQASDYSRVDIERSTITPSSVRFLKDLIAICYLPALVARSICSCVASGAAQKPDSLKRFGSKLLEDSS
jgi:hypothetical protein